MEYEDVLRHLSPCGLDCVRCADFQPGRIRQLALELRDLLGNYYRVAKLKAAHNSVFGQYPSFADILSQLSNASCGGCRSDDVRCPISCGVKTCHKEKGVDFCFQCEEFPCNPPMESALKERWKNRNDRMLEIGVVPFYEEQVKLPRY